MNYSELIQLLDHASAFDLFRLRAALNNMIEDPRRLQQVKNSLRLGMSVKYYEPSENCIHEAIVEQIKQTRVIVRNIQDNRRWDISLSAINIHDADITIQQTNKKGLTKNEVKVGDIVGFIDRTGRERSGRVEKLNQKTVSLKTEHGNWRVDFGLLHKVIDLDIETTFLTESTDTANREVNLIQFSGESD